MTITKEQVLAIMPNAKDCIDKFMPYINKYAVEFEINTPLRMAHYLAQLAHESNELRATVENLNYSATALLRVFPKYFSNLTATAYARNPKKIASRVYANRMGNGNEASGDGYKYRGRGLFQLTGKDNYKKYKDFCGFDVLAKPELLELPLGATRSSMWFWKKNGLNELADKDEFKAITKKINGGYNGLEKRQKYLTMAKKVLIK